MRFCGVDGSKFSETERNTLESKSKECPDVKDFLTVLSVCHTVIPETDDDGKVVYNAASPDEKAFVDAARDYGYEFISRKSDQIEMKDWTGQTVKYDILAIVEFTSARKRMSVIIRSKDGAMKLLTKGADNVMMERLEKSKTVGWAEEMMADFAREGLRTMVFGMRYVMFTHLHNLNLNFNLKTFF